MGKSIHNAFQVIGLFIVVCAVMGNQNTLDAVEISWRLGTVHAEPMESELLEQELSQICREARTQTEGGKAIRHLVVQFAGSVDDRNKATVEQQGLSLLRPLGNNAFFAVIDVTSFNASAIAQSNLLAYVSSIQLDWKLHRDIRSERIPPWAVVSKKQGTDEPDVIAVYVVFHPDIPLAVDAMELCQRHGAIVRSIVQAINGLVVELPLANVTTLAEEDPVQWIEPPLPRMEPVNDSIRVITEVNEVQTAPYGLNGLGVNVLVYDAGTADPSHPDFGGRLHVRDSSGTDPHPTHVSGTIGGNGSRSQAYGGTPLQWRGMAPGVAIQSYGFEYDGSGIFLYTNPGDLENDYFEAINTYGAQISNNSIGTNTCWNEFPCEITGDYCVTSALIDAVVTGSLGVPFRIVWANGNERSCPFCPNEHQNGYHSTAPPACAKNHITVGALNSNDDSMTEFSSWGPADDGRLKPDICAPGDELNGVAKVKSCFPGGSYELMRGTSMAAPTVTGIAALMLQDYRAQFPVRPDFRNSTLKILLAHNAVDLGNTGPDYQFGYGSVRSKQTIDFMRTGSFIEHKLNQGQSSCALIEVSQDYIQSGQPLKVTLAWDDFPGTPNVSPALVNDLDLRVYDPTGTVRYYPWTLDPANPANPAIRGQEDHINNIEQVVVDNANLTVGVWRVEVYGYSIPESPQPFSLCASPVMAVDCNCDLNPDEDPDGDGLPSECGDNCPNNFNPDQKDCDEDEIGDVCDDGDSDGDSISDNQDNCPCDANQDQLDCDADGLGDVCETDPDCDNNGVPDNCEYSDANCNGQHDACEDVLYVDKNAPPESAQDGSKWDDAFLSIEDGLTAAENSGLSKVMILVAEGVYRPDTSGLGNPREATFTLSYNGTTHISLFGGFAGSGAENPYEHAPAVHKTVLSGDIGIENYDSDNCYHVVTSDYTVTSETILDGFYIMGGNANETPYVHDRGAGMINNGGDPQLSNCWFLGNEATGPGGGVYLSSGNATLDNCVFSGNSAERGGAIYASCNGIFNCTIAYNNSTGINSTGGAEIYSLSSAMNSCILWGNRNVDGVVNELDQCSVGPYQVNYNIIEKLGVVETGNGVEGIGNIDADPLFIDADGDDDIYGNLDDNLHIKTGSPAIDSGDNTSVPYTICSDIEGNNRFLDDPAAEDNGNGTAPIVDRGAYEYDVAGGDCNGNGVPDDQDINGATSSDCDENDIPDECDPDNDNDLDGCDCLGQTECNCGPDDCDNDDDNDGVLDNSDNCQFDFNPSQRDCDGDGPGDACDNDTGRFFDFDNDCDVDQDDFAHMQECYSYDVVQSVCEDADPTGDGYVLSDDILIFEGCATAPGIYADPGCGGKGEGGGGGQGEEGGEMLVSAGEESYEPYVMAWFVDSQTGASDTKLSAGGGAVSLNLVLDSEVPVAGFSGSISVSTAGDDDTRDDAGGDVTDGCQVGGLSVTYITSGYMPGGDAKLTVCDLHIPGSDSQAKSEADSQAPITLLTSDFGFDVGLNALSMLEAPEEWVFSVAIDPATIDLPAEAKCDDIWAQFFSPGPELYLDALGAGQSVVASISLQFAAEGTYNITFTEGIATAATGQQANITPGPDLEITVPID